MKKEQIYKWIKISGILSYIPFVLAAGPLAGYAVGNYIEKRFKLPEYVSYSFSGLGFLAAAIEIVRIIKFVVRLEKKNDG